MADAGQHKQTTAAPLGLRAVATPHLPMPGFVVRSDPIFDARYDAGRIREEMMPASIDVTPITTAEDFFGPEFIAANGLTYTRYLTEEIGKMNIYYTATYANDFVRARLPSECAQDPSKNRAFVDLVARPVHEVFSQAEIDQYGTHGEKLLQKVLEWIEHALTATEDYQVKERGVTEQHRQIQEKEVMVTEEQVKQKQEVAPKTSQEHDSNAAADLGAVRVSVKGKERATDTRIGKLILHVHLLRKKTWREKTHCSRSWRHAADQSQGHTAFMSSWASTLRL
jgi:hypothetical protein